MNLFELFVKIGAKDEASGTISKITSGLGKGLATAAKIGTAAVGAAATGITALTTAALNNYAEYEQLVGGVETLFKNSADTVMKYADGAYASAGLSANQYMTTVTSFSASLLQSLGGDTEAAAKKADVAITDMADNANKMGTSIEMLQTTYAGFAKQNFTMLDNLKLGYGGTKEEMQRLLDDASKISGIKYDISSFADITDAIHVMQEEMGIAGATALEAGTTIQGSIGAMEGAWTNLVTGFADGNADIGGLIDNLVTTIVGDGTESNLGVIGNVLPAIETALGGIVKLIAGAAPKIIEILPGLASQIVPSLISAATGLVDAVTKVLPDLLNTLVTALVENAPLLITAAVDLVQSLIQGIEENYQILIDGAFQIVTQLATGILNMLPQVAKLGLDLIVSLANGIAENLPALIPTVVDVILQLVDTLTSPEQLQNLLSAALTLVLSLVKGIIGAIPNLLDAAFQIVNNLIDFILNEDNLNSIINAALEIILVVTEGLAKAIPQLIDAAIQIIEKLCDFLLNPENISMLLDMAFKLIVAIVEGLGKATVALVKGATKLIKKIVEIFKETDWKEIGKSIVDGLLTGLKNTWDTLKKWFTDAWDSLVGGVKDLLGIHSPSRVFAGIGQNMALGVGEGWEDEFGDIQGDIDKSLSFDDASIGITSSIRKVGAGEAGGYFGGTSIGNITINIDGAKYSDEQSLAAAVAEAIQEMTDRRTAVYA